MVLAAGAGRSILLPQLPQKRLSVGTSAPQFGQSLPDMFVLTSARHGPPARALSTVRRASQAGRRSSVLRPASCVLRPPPRASGEIRAGFPPEANPEPRIF